MTHEEKLEYYHEYYRTHKEAFSARARKKYVKARGGNTPLIDRWRILTDFARSGRPEMQEIEALLDSVERDILRYRYICGFPWEATAQKIGYSRNYTQHRGKRIADMMLEAIHARSNY